MLGKGQIFLQKQEAKAEITKDKGIKVPNRNAEQIFTTKQKKTVKKGTIISSVTRGNFQR